MFGDDMASSLMDGTSVLGELAAAIPKITCIYSRISPARLAEIRLLLPRLNWLCAESTYRNSLLFSVTPLMILLYS